MNSLRWSVAHEGDGMDQFFVVAESSSFFKLNFCKRLNFCQNLVIVSLHVFYQDLVFGC